MHAKRNQKRYHQLIFSEVLIESIRSHKLDIDIPYLTTGTSDTTNTNKNLIHNVTRANAWQNTYSWILIQNRTIKKTSKTVPFLFLKNWRKKGCSAACKGTKTSMGRDHDLSSKICLQKTETTSGQTVQCFKLLLTLQTQRVKQMKRKRTQWV